MKTIFINIAVDKASATEQRAALQALREVVAAYEAADASFVERINASKAKRGEAPTKQSPAQQKQLAAFEQDRITLDEAMATGMADFLQRFPDAEAEERA